MEKEKIIVDGKEEEIVTNLEEDEMNDVVLVDEDTIDLTFLKDEINNE